MDEIKEQIKDKSKLKELGKGQFGVVYKLEYKGKEYAIKKISKDKIDNSPSVEYREYLKNALQREIDILKKMSEFENSVKLYGHFTEEKDYILVLEFCDSDLKNLLKEKGKLASSEILTIMEGLNKPFKYMYKNGILHRDIKPENIMIKFVDSSKTKYIAKIGDYGISRELDNGIATTILGSPVYMSPEMLLEVDEYTAKSDLFSLGVMIYQLHFNSFPFTFPMHKKDIEKNYNKKKEKDCEDKLLDDLLNKLLMYNPDDRISWDDYFRHPFFTQKGVEDLTNQLDKTKIYDEKEHQIINVYDYVLDKMVDFNTSILITPRENISIDECLKLKDEPFFILGILGKYLEQIGISVLIDREESKRNPEISEYQKNIIQSICNSYISKKKYLLDFDLGEDKIKLLVGNPIERSKFNEKIRKTVMKIFNLKEEELLISNHRRENNKFTTIIVMKSNFSKEITKDELIKVFSEDEELKTLEKVDKELLMPKITLSKSMLFPREDNKKDKWAIGEKRGGEDYMPPLGWIKYGININHGFNDRSNDWISHKHKRGEWAVAYCGIGITESLKQVYEDDDDIKSRNDKVGVGVYCPSDPRLLEKYAGTVNANGEEYKVGFMVRVKPDKIRASEKDQNMWVVNGNDNELRPYGILIKKV